MICNVCSWSWSPVVVAIVLAGLRWYSVAVVMFAVCGDMYTERSVDTIRSLFAGFLLHVLRVDRVRIYM